jgi:GR25 family glycosyltransferase involved in LPS biosynthesis
MVRIEELHRINKEFDKVVCINLVNRKDKREAMKKKFKEMGIVVEWFNAVPYGFAPEIVNSLKPTTNDYPRFNIKTPNEFGAAISHYTVIKTALLEGVEKIFVFEDDVLFRKEFNDKFDKYYDSLPEDWDMFLLYSFMYKIQPQNVRVNAKWVKSYDSWSLMSYGMKKKAMERYIADQDKMFQIADRASFKMQGKELNIYSAVPTLCIPNQKFGSNIRESMNYVNTNTILNMGYSNENYE